MLRLQGIKKNYVLPGGMTVEALKGIDVRFRKSEFVSILGHSGCGKTTLLNIIGGLDQPSDGTLYIGGVSTAKYGDRDWDTYRNHSIGFIFQSYNLIPHMSVLANVELAPTIAGLSKAERKKRSIKALEQVGLGDQIHKKPNQLSGGQMQRVAIARALVNDPEILLADEPTGALDTETSIQIMEILKSIAKDRLIIMVTHNPELAERYSTRIISLKDGLVVDDTDPYVVAEYDNKPAKKEKKQKKASMSFFTAFELSLKNLMTKKARTILTSFAGSIGIIGIALILALSTGVQAYIDQVQEDTLSAFPLTLNKQTADTSALLNAMIEINENQNIEYEEDKIYPDDTMGSMINAMTQVKTNDLAAFKEYFEKNKNDISGSLNAYKYVYDLNVQIYNKLETGETIAINPTTVFDYMGDLIGDYMSSMSALTGGSAGMSFFGEMLSGMNGELVNPLVTGQYELIGAESRWPTASNEVILVVDEKNRISTMALYALGFKDPHEIEDVLGSLLDPDKEYDNGIEEGFCYELSDFIGHSFKYVMNADYYVKGEGSYTVDGVKYPVWVDAREQVGYDQEAFVEEHGKDLIIVGIVRAKADATSTSLTTPIGYTEALSNEVIAYNTSSDIAKQQQATPDHNVFTGTTFKSEEFTPENAEKFVELLSSEQRAQLITTLNQLMQISITEESLPELLKVLSDEGFASIVKMMIPQTNFTKDNIPEFIASLTEEQKAGLCAMLSQNSGQQITAEMLPNVLGALDDQNFAMIVSQFASAESEPTYTKENIPTFLEAIGTEGKAALLEMLKKNMEVTDANLADSLKQLDEKSFASLVTRFLPEEKNVTLDKNLSLIGYQDDSRLSAIYLYPVDFKEKDAIKSFVEKYNNNVEEAKRVEVSDIMGSLISGINTIIDVISWVLIAFVAISLIVSSIMIAIITYISVIERTKEIGILRSLGASKRNIRNVFNAETLIEGLCSGLLGVAVTYLVCAIANPIIHTLSGINSINAILPWYAALALIAISICLTVFAGLIPAYAASKKDPVIALRTE